MHGCVPVDGESCRAVGNPLRSARGSGFGTSCLLASSFSTIPLSVATRRVDQPVSAQEISNASDHLSIQSPHRRYVPAGGEPGPIGTGSAQTASTPSIFTVLASGRPLLTAVRPPGSRVRARTWHTQDDVHHEHVADLESQRRTCACSCRAEWQCSVDFEGESA